VIAYFLFQIWIQRGQIIKILLFSSRNKTKNLNLLFSVIRCQKAHTYLLHKTDIKYRTYYMLWNFVIIISLLVAFLTLAHVLPDDGTFLPKHVGVTPPPFITLLLFICIWYSALGWFNKLRHWSGMQWMNNFKINVTRRSDTQSANQHMHTFNFLFIKTYLKFLKTLLHVLVIRPPSGSL
jgi:hypothetical protein